MNAASGEGRRAEAEAYFHSLYRLHAHHRACKAGVEFFSVGHTAAEAALQAVHAHLDHAARGVASGFKFVDKAHCALLRPAVQHKQRTGFCRGEGRKGVLAAVFNAADGLYVAAHLHAEL